MGVLSHPPAALNIYIHAHIYIYILLNAARTERRRAAGTTEGSARGKRGPPLPPSSPPAPALF